MTARWAFAAVLTLGAALTACTTSTPGAPVTSPKSPTEPNFPTISPTAAPPKTLMPAPTTTAPARGTEVLPPENGYVFIATKSGKTRCQLNEEEVGCEAQFTNSPVLDGTHANGTIVAGEDGTRFTSDRTRHGMTVAVDGVQAF
jgi:hypothetical protein